MNWKQFVMVAGGTAAAGAILYYLLREDSSDSKEEEGEKKKINTEEATKEQVLQILKNILDSQDEMKNLMRDFTNDFIKNDYTFQEAYDKVTSKPLDDPLDHYGLSMSDFDRLLDRYQYEPSIKDAILRIMGTTSPPMSAKAETVTHATIISVHEYMKVELNKLLQEIQKSNRSGVPSIKYDMKNITLAAQAYVGAKVQKKYGLTSEDIEAAVILNQKELTVDPEFARVNLAIHSIMNQLIGNYP